MKKLLFVLLLSVGCTLNTKKTSQGEATKTRDLAKDSMAPRSESIYEANKFSYYHFDTYCNARFGFCIEYPKDILTPGDESENGDGRIFSDTSGQTTLRVFGRIAEGVDGHQISIAQQYAEDLKTPMTPEGTEEFIITYKKLGEDFFVISGYANGKFHGRKVFYQKTIAKNGAFAYAILTYNETQQKQFNSVPGKVFKSFR
jgi:hypothetical protein